MKNQSNQVKERPIIFSAEMVKAILDGKKTMTRRVIKINHDLSPYTHVDFDVDGDNKWELARINDLKRTYTKIGNPYGNVGDRLWVRETWIQGYDDPLIESEGDDENAVSIIYKADGKEEYRTCSAETAENWGDFSADSEMVGFKSPIHMPRWASRILLEITDIRVERLNDISEADCEKEGLRILPASGRYVVSPGDQYFGSASHDAVEVFSWLWDSINAKKGYPWSSNPWVWCISFNVIEVA